MNPRDTESGLGCKPYSILYTGNLDKRNPVNGGKLTGAKRDQWKPAFDGIFYHTRLSSGSHLTFLFCLPVTITTTAGFHGRFLVLTHDAVHWFKRTDGSDLFGAERGHATLDSILTVRVLDEDSTCFELQTLGQMKRIFRANNPQLCEEWVSAIRSAIKGLDMRTDGHENGTDVVVTLVSLRSNGSELVISRNPTWGRVINVPDMKSGDELAISTSNGGIVSLLYDTLTLKAEDALDFDAPVQSVTLASSLKLSVRECVYSSEAPPPTSASVSQPPTRLKSMNTTVSRVIKHLSLITKDQSNSVTLVLSAMVLLVGVASIPHVGPDTSLLFMFSFLLAVYNMQRLLVSGSISATGLQGTTLTIILHSHAFTSPDAPLNRPEDEIPQRFIDGMGGDLKEARRRWDITHSWREKEGVNDILHEKQPHFFVIKKHYPFYHCGRGTKGHVVFYERPGDLESTQLLARGITTVDLIRHWIFVTEYQWNVILEGDEAAKSISVIDVGTVKMGDLAGDNFTYVSTTIGYANAHYPERSYVIYIVNAPMWFSYLWKMLKPMVHENTQNKVRILSRSETLKGLQEHIDLADIPEYYGGGRDFGGSDSCRWKAPEVEAMADYVKRLNEGEKMELVGSKGGAGGVGGGEVVEEESGRGHGHGPGHDQQHGHGHGHAAGLPASGKSTGKASTPAPAPSTPASTTSSGSKMYTHPHAPISPLTSDGGAGGEAEEVKVKRKGWLLSRNK